jgi:PAS domain S-box-containing protein
MQDPRSPPDPEALGGEDDSGRLNPYLEDLSRKLVWLFVFRGALAALLLTGIVWVARRAGSGTFVPGLRVAVAAAVAALGFTAASVFWMRRIRRWIPFTYLQLSFDLLLWTTVVYGTGGPGSYFVYLLDLVVLLGAVYLGTRGVAVLGAAAFALYVGLAAALARGFLPWPTGYEPANPAEASALLSVVKLAPDAVSILGVTLLGAYLARRAQQVSRGYREAERAHADLAARSEFIVRSLPVGLITADQGGRIRTANPEACRLLGRSDADLLGRPLHRVVGLPTLQPGVDATETGELHLERPEGAAATADYAAARLRDAAGTPIGTLVILRDMTEIRAIQRDLARAERLSALGKISAGLAHEIRNPLGAIRGAIELLPSDPDDPDAARLRPLLLREVDRINELVTQMLTLARPVPPRPARVRLRPLVDEVVTLARRDPRLSPGRIEVDLPGDPEAWADGAQLRQIVWNLVKNALQEAPEGGPVRVSGAEAPDGGIEVCIEDGGPGIAEDERDRIFDLFYSRRPYGVGIGLAIVRQLVTNHGGRVEVDRSDLGGARFRVWLPAGPVPLADPGASG